MGVAKSATRHPAVVAPPEGPTMEDLAFYLVMLLMAPGPLIVIGLVIALFAGWNVWMHKRREAAAPVRDGAASSDGAPSDLG
jgi:hypothetical protein